MRSHTCLPSGHTQLSLRTAAARHVRSHTTQQMQSTDLVGGTSDDWIFVFPVVGSSASFRFLHEVVIDWLEGDRRVYPTHAPFDYFPYGLRDAGSLVSDLDWCSDCSGMILSRASPSWWDSFGIFGLDSTRPADAARTRVLRQIISSGHEDRLC